MMKKQRGLTKRLMERMVIPSVKLASLLQTKFFQTYEIN